MDTPPDIRNLIIQYHRDGYTCGQIANIVKRPRPTVIRLVKQYRDTGSTKVMRTGMCGRHLLLSEREERTLARASVINPKLTARELRSVVGGKVAQVSVSTVKRALKRQGKARH